jgi:hypothetical protein
MQQTAQQQQQGIQQAGLGLELGVVVQRRVVAAVVVV